MKRICIAAITVFVCLPVFAQVNYSGAYGYSSKPPANTGNDQEARGPSGNLVLLKMEGSKYRFWLDVTIGWPNYNAGEADGTITFVNDTASFDNTFDDADKPCILNFRITDSTITINSLSSSFNCGFGNGVHADGEYVKLKKQPVMNYDWLKKQYHQTPTIIIAAGKAEVFRDEIGVRPFSKPLYFVKGDSLMNIAETEKTVYTEFITPAGNFIYGWINKKDLKPVVAE